MDGDSQAEEVLQSARDLLQTLRERRRSTQPPRQVNTPKIIEEELEPRNDELVSDTDFDESEIELPEYEWVAAVQRTPLMVWPSHIEHAKWVEAGVLSEAVLAGELERPLGGSDSALRQIAKRGQESFRSLVEGNLRLVLSMALGYGRGDREEAQECFQDGYQGLVRAIYGWDHRRGYTFSTYATWWIRQSITRGMTVRTRNIRIPVHVYDALYRPSAGTANPDSEALLQARALMEGAWSWERVLELDSELLDELMPTTIIEDWSDWGLAEVVNQALENVGQLMDVRARDIIERRFGLGGHDPVTLEEIGQEWGVSRERIRQIEVKALKLICVLIVTRNSHLRERIIQLASADEMKTERAAIVAVIGHPILVLRPGSSAGLGITRSSAIRATDRIFSVASTLGLAALNSDDG